MNLLIDTHVFLWWDSQPEKIPSRTLSALEDPDNTVWLSLVSIWEVQIKTQMGKLALNQSLDSLVQQQQQNDIQLLPIKLNHILALQPLPYYHKDPFDRLLIAQSIAENLTCVSADSVFKQYNIPILW
jgi:PIN domain nuclease of toxin-antitoxin system